jgi:hypothetical protein
MSGAMLKPRTSTIMIATIPNTTPVVMLFSSEPMVAVRCWRRSAATDERSTTCRDLLRLMMPGTAPWPARFISRSMSRWSTQRTSQAKTSSTRMFSGLAISQSDAEASQALPPVHS